MRAEERFLSAVGDYNANIDSYKASRDEGERARSIFYGFQIAGNILQRVVCGGIVTFDYVTNARIINPLPKLDERLVQRYGYPGSTVGLAAQLCEWHGRELPESFESFVERERIESKAD